jgi:hypothetical protein
MKTNNKISAYILRGSTGALLFSSVIVALCSAINLSEQPLQTRPPQDKAAFGANVHQNRSLSFADRVAYQRAIEDVYWRHRTPEVSRSEAAVQSGLVRMIPGSTRNWIAVNASSTIQPQGNIE